MASKVAIQNGTDRDAGIKRDTIFHCIDTEHYNNLIININKNVTVNTKYFFM